MAAKSAWTCAMENWRSTPRRRKNCRQSSSRTRSHRGHEKERRPSAAVLRCGMGKPLSAHAVGDAALGQVVRRHFHLDLVAGEDADVVLAHAARNMSSHDVPVFQLHAEHGVGQGFLHRTFHFDDVVFGHGLRWAREKGTPHFAMKWRLAKAPIARGTVWPCETMAVHSSNRHKLRLVCELLHATLARFRQGTPRDARRLRPSSP